MANEKRLIDAKPLMQNGWHLVKTGESNRFICSMSLADVPTVDAVEVVHGRWETVPSSPGYLSCSQCKDVYIWETWPGDGKWNYCPNCGAHMDAEEA